MRLCGQVGPGRRVVRTLESCDEVLSNLGSIRPFNGTTTTSQHTSTNLTPTSCKISLITVQELKSAVETFAVASRLSSSRLCHDAVRLISSRKVPR